MRIRMLTTTLPILAVSLAFAPMGALGQSIVGGQQADSSETYSTIVIMDSQRNDVACGGTLIAPTVVLTAAHCILEPEYDYYSYYGYEFGDEYPPEAFYVVANTIVASQAQEEDSYDVAQVIAHDDFSLDAGSDPTGIGQANDIGLLILSEPIEDVPLATILPMESVDEEMTEGTPLIITGWGMQGSYSEPMGVLHIAEVPFVRRTDHEFIAGGEGEADSCPGDSGGPVYYEGDDGIFSIGIVSRGTSTSYVMCGDGGIYTLTSAYVDWIETNSGGAYPPDVVVTGDTSTPDVGTTDVGAPDVGTTDDVGTFADTVGDGEGSGNNSSGGGSGSGCLCSFYDEGPTPDVLLMSLLFMVFLHRRTRAVKPGC